MQWGSHQALPIGWIIWVSHFVASLHPLLDLVNTIWQGTRIASNGCSVLPRTAKERNYITTLPTEEEEEENPRNPFEFSQPSSFRQSLDHRREYRLITASKQNKQVGERKALTWVRKNSKSTSLVNCKPMIALALPGSSRYCMGL